MSINLTSPATLKHGHAPDFKSLSSHIHLEWIIQALSATGKASIRRRKLPAEQVVWLVIALALFRHQSIPEVVAHLDLLLPDQTNPDIAKSALTQSRQRLGEAPLAQLFALCAAAWDIRRPNEPSWRGLSCYALDGSTLRTSDGDANRAHFGAQAYASGVVSSYPQVRMVTLTSLSTLLIRAADFGEYGCNEMRYAEETLQALPDHSLCVMDKGFLSAALLLGLQRQGAQRHWLIPAKGNTRWHRLAGHDADQLVRMRVSPQARKADPNLPEYWEARAIRVRDQRGRERTLLTSLLDTRAYPAEEVAAQYAHRWRIETSYRELKQSLLGDAHTLRSGAPETIRQEIWGCLLAYNLVRLEMAEVAREALVKPTDLSFTMALHYLRSEWGWLAITSPGKLPAHLVRLRERLGEWLLPKQRRGRICPRVVKQKPARYPTKVVLK